MKYLRMTLAPDVVSPNSPVISGYLLNLQLQPDGTILELVLARVDPDDLTTAMDTNTDTDTEHFAHEVVEIGDDQCYIYQHCQPTEQTQHLLQLLNEHRLMLIFPIEFDAQTGTTVEVIGSESDVQNGFTALPADVRQRTSIERMSDYSPGTTGVRAELTDRQREILNAAVAVGYYDVPRRGTADDVAAVDGCASSTASEHLRKIEARILSALVQE